MENITIGQIAAAIALLTVFGGFISSIFIAISKWWKTRVTDKFTTIDKRLDTVENRLTEVESKKLIYEHELQNSKEERKILLRGELAALKGLYELNKSESLSHSIQEIEEYVMEKTHD